MNSHPSAHPTASHGIGHSDNIFLWLTLQMETSHKKIDLSHTQVVFQETEQQRKPMMSTPTEKHGMHTIGDKRKDFVGKSIRHDAIGSKQTHIGWSRSGQREKSERRRRTNYARHSRNIKGFEGFGTWHTYLF